jgi:hypothetical protein
MKTDNQPALTALVALSMNIDYGGVTWPRRSPETN